MVKKAKYLVLLLLSVATAWGVQARPAVDRLSRRGASGRIAVQAGGKHLPGNAEVTLKRTRASEMERRVKDGVSRRRHRGGASGGRRLLKAAANGAATAQPNASTGAAERPVNVLAMYDIAISADGEKWQPAAGEPVRVTVELDEPVTVKEGAPLGVVHLSDDGEVEELDSSRYGFTYDATRTAVTAFWFDATGFSVYAITESGGTYSPNRRLYDFYSLDFDRFLEDGVTPNPTYNTYVPRYFTTVEGNKTFRQIIKSGEILERPEVLPSPLGRTFIGWFLYATNKANQTVEGVTYDSEGYATTKFDFTKPIEFADTPDGGDENHGAREFVLRSRFARKGYVIFHEQPVGGDWPITAVRRAEMTEQVDGSETNMVASVNISDLKVTYDDTNDTNQEGQQHENTAPRMIFRGWSETPVLPGKLTDTNGNNVVILQNPYVFSRVKDTEARPRHLFPVFANINWLTFLAAEAGAGATYIPPRFYYQDEGTNTFPVSSRTGYVFDGWWTTSNDVAGVTGVQVSTPAGALRTNLTANEKAAIGTWGGKIEGGNLMLTNSVTLYGRWSMGKAKYTVVVMRQSVEDDKDTPVKTYDFAFSVTNLVDTESTASVNNFYKQLTTRVDNSLNQGRDADSRITTDDFNGFYYSHCDDDTTVKGDGTTVLRVYYDRYKVTYTFNSTTSSAQYIYTESTAVPYLYTATDQDYYTYTETSLGYYVYTPTTKGYENYEVYTTTDGSGNSNTDVTPSADDKYYRLNNGNYTRVYYRNGRWRTSNSDSGSRYKNGTVYYVKSVNEIYGTSDDNNPNDDNTFQIYYVNSDWRTINADDGTRYNGTHYERTINEETLYGVDDEKRYFELAYVDGGWQNATNGVAYTDTRYTRAESNPGAVYYGTEKNASPYDTTPFELSYENGNWYTNNAVYAGTRYTREVNDVGTLYGVANGASPYTGTPFEIEFVGDTWQKKSDGTAYTGKRYTRTGTSTGSWRPMTSLPDPSMTGLYGQPLSISDYKWPIAYKWMDNFGTSYYGTSATGTGMTYLDSFNAISYPRTSTNNTTHTITTAWFLAGENDSAEIIHVFQDLNGNYSLDNSVTTYGSANSTFYFSNKFEGFMVCGYTLGTFTSTPDTPVGDDGSVSTQGNRLYVYHARRKYTLTFCDSYNLTPYSEVEVYYGAPLASYQPSGKPTPTEQTMKKGYSFTGWYSDQATSTKFNFNTTMPRANLVAYAGWETEWYLIKIDPNYGKLPAGQSTWFWEPYNGDPIEEYSATTRSFVEAVNGTWFYAIKNRDYYGYPDEWVSGEAGDRGAYYTQDQSDPAIVQDGKRYKEAVNAYRYAGWYEVDPDTGTEKLYGFGQPVQRNTTLKLHWKHIGTYRLHYEPNIGTMSDGDENETTFNILDAGVYADSSEVLVTRTAVPPPGYSFAGWRIRYGDGEVLHPGQQFFFNAAYTVTVPDANGNPVQQLVLDAVYSKVSTVSLTTDANGGWVDPEVAVTLPLAYPNAPTLITNITDTARTVSGMRNNAYGTLSDGEGYHCIVQDEAGNDVKLNFLGWNTKADGTGTHFDGGTFIGIDTLDVENGRNVLYAEWGVRVYFDKNRDTGVWQDDLWQAQSDTYAWDPEKKMYYQETTLNGYAKHPGIPLKSTAEDEMFVLWSTNRYTAVDQLKEFDFSQPITRPITLHARWSNFIRVPFHVVDSSFATPVLMDDAWLHEESRQFKIGNYADVSFSDEPSQYLHDVPATHAYAFTCVSASPEGVSDAADRRIVRMYYNTDRRTVYVDYANGTTGPMPDDKEIYVVYYTNPRPITIAYEKMESDGGLTPVATNAASAAPGWVAVDGDATNMATVAKAPKSYPVDSSDFKYYAYAIGETNAASSAQLRFITGAKGLDDNVRPVLWVRNTWRGCEYCTDDPSAENAVWNRYGADAQLYVVYFTSQTTIINFKELTVGTEADMAERFEYVVAVSNVSIAVTNWQTRTLSTTRSSQTSTYNRQYTYYHKYRTYGGDGREKTAGPWYYYYSDSEWKNPTPTKVETGRPVFEGEQSSVYALSDGGVETVALFTSVVGDNNWVDGGVTNASNSAATEVGSWVREGSAPTRGTLTLVKSEYKVTTTNMQMVVITQRPKEAFRTVNDIDDGEYVFTQTSATTNAAYRVTFTNTRKELPVELHVAFSQNGTIDHVDNAWRSETTNDYTVAVALKEDGTFAVASADLEAKEGTLIKEGLDLGDRRFMGVYYGKADESDGADENKAVLKGKVTSVGLVKPEGSEYYELCLNGDPALKLAGNRLYCVYCAMPRIYYVATGANGSLTKRDTVAFEGNAVSMGNPGETEIVQGTLLEVGADAAYTVAAGGGTADFRVPMVIDGVEHASLSRMAFGAGAADVASTNAMDVVTSGASIRLKVVDAVLKWSVDGETWGDFTGAPAIYSIYKEAGHDLTITEISLASDADKAVDEFMLTIKSDNLTNGVTYLVSGYKDESVTPTPDGVITLTLTNGCSITIQSLPNDGVSAYVLTETLPAVYALTNLTVDGNVPLVRTDFGTSVYMQRDAFIEFTNIKRYDVTFVDEDGTTPLADATPYWYGTKAAEIAAPGSPAKAMDATYIYRFTAWNPVLEDVGSNAVYTAAYRAIKIPQATQRAADTNLVVSLSKEEAQAREEALVQALKDVGIDLEDPGYSEAAATEALNKVDPNGLRHWENLVTGTSTNHLLLSTVTMTNNTESTISLVQDEDPQAPIARALGYEVLYDLKRLHNVQEVANREWGRVAGPSNTPSFTVRLIDGEGNSLGAAGYYRVYTLIVPHQDLSITNVIPSTNIIGVLEVNSPLKNTMTAVPWKALATAPEDARPVAVQNYVDIGQLNDNDKLTALDGEGTYQQWTLKNGEWTPAVNVSEVKGAMTIKSAPKAEVGTLNRGGATWVSRTETDKPYFLVGQYTGEKVEITIERGTSEKKGSTMVTNPTLYPIKINDIDWGNNPSAEDVIQVPNGLAVPIALLWRNGSWGYSAKVYDPKRRMYVKEWRTDVTVSSGTGFWYYRTGEAFTVSIAVDQVD